MLYLGIAVAVVSGLLIGFVTLSVIWTAKTVGKNIQERSLDLLSTYDELLENRSRELSALDVELENRKKELGEQPEENGDEQAAATAEEPTGDPVAFLRAAEQLSTTPYQDSGAGETYQRIRQTFAAITDEAVRKLVEQSRAEPETGAGALLKDLPFDTVEWISHAPPNLLSLAVMWKLWYFAESLVSKGLAPGVEVVQILTMLIRSNDAWVIEILLREGMEIPKDYYPAFRACVNNNSAEAAKTLIDYGFDVDAYCAWAQQYGKPDEGEQKLVEEKENDGNDRAEDPVS